MKYVGVQHKENQQAFWFQVPNELNKFVGVGSEVICDTRRGEALGTVVSVLDGLPDRDLNGIGGFQIPTKKILGVAAEVELAQLNVPLDMELSAPSSSKIAKRIDEFYTCGKFSTPVVFSPNDDLTDGYTAYLVAKMFGHKTLSGFYVCV